MSPGPAGVELRIAPRRPSREAAAPALLDESRYGDDPVVDARGGLRNIIDDLVDRISRIRLPLSRPGPARSRELSEARPHRFEALRWRLRSSRLGRSADGIIVVPLLAVVLVLGVFTATAASRRSSDGGDSDLAPAPNGTDVVTETKTHMVTVKRPGKRDVVTVERTRVRKRVVKGPGGVSTVFESAGPGETKTVSGPTKTVTVTGPSHTVTQVLTETVTTVVTVTEKKKP
jgi:hypothetical protein